MVWALIRSCSFVGGGVASCEILHLLVRRAVLLLEHLLLLLLWLLCGGALPQW